MSILSTTLVALTAFFGGFFISQSTQETEQTDLIELSKFQIDQNVRDFYASIIHSNDATFQTLLKTIKPDCCLPHGTTPLSFAIEQKKYSYCQQLLLHDFTATLQDLQKAESLQIAEPDSAKKKQAQVFVQFLTQHLQDKNLLPNTGPAQRGKYTQTSHAKAAQSNYAQPAQAAQSSANQDTTQSFDSIDYQFIQATEKGDVILMARLKQQGANPNATINCMRALPSAIAFAHLDALHYLLNQDVPITPQDLERAALYQKIHETNQNDCDRSMPTIRQDLEQAATHQKNHSELEKGSREYKAETEKILKLISKERSQNAFGVETILRQRVFDMLISHIRRKPANTAPIEPATTTQVAPTLARDKKP